MTLGLSTLVLTVLKGSLVAMAPVFFVRLFKRILPQ